MNKTKWIILGVVIIIVVWAISGYNGLIKAEQAVNVSWGQVETDYQRRMDLIPNLVNTVKGNTEQEKEVFGALAEARTKYGGSVKVEDKINAAQNFESALGRLLVIAENYPDLKSSQAFRDLMTNLEGSENRISVSRKNYNESVGAYNVKIKTFPRNILAGIFNFEAKTLFESQDGAEKAPIVDFNK